MSFVSYIVPIASGLLFGLGLGNIGGVINDASFLRYFSSPSPETIGLLVGTMQGGALLGSMFAGPSSDRFGRRGVVLASAFIIMFGSAMAVLPLFLHAPLAAIFGSRFAVGIGSGSLVCAAPIYVAETALPEKRGAVMVSFQLFIQLGIVLANLINYRILAESELGWCWSLAQQLPWAVLLGLCMYSLPESPQWLAASGQLKDGQASLLIFRASAESPEDEFQSLIASSENPCSTDSNWDNSACYGWNSKLAMALMTFQVATGIDIFVSYTPSMLKEALGNAADKDPLYYTLCSGAILFSSSLVAFATVDYWGRRPLLIVSSLGQTLSLSVLCWSNGGWLTVVMVYMFVASFGMGWGPVTFVTASELLHSRVRSRVVAIGAVLSWLVVFTVTSSYLTLVVHVGQHSTFRIYGAVNIIAAIFVVTCLPETRGTELDKQHAGHTSKTEPTFYGAA